MKICRGCGQEQSLEAFSIERRARDGRQSRCKGCDASAKKAAYQANPEKLRTRAQQWRAVHPDEKHAHDARYRQRHPGKTEAQRAWLRSQPERVRLIARAGAAVQRAIKRGALVRPDVCEACSVRCVPEAAHHDYSLPLEVWWLCKPCHRTADHHNPRSLVASC